MELFLFFFVLKGSFRKGVSCMQPVRSILSLILSLSLLCGCASAPAGSSASAVSPLPRPEGEVETVVSNCETVSPYGLSGFGVELLNASRREGENALLSPLSVVLALSMTSNGARGETLAQFEQTFGMEQDSLNALCAGLLAKYSALGGSTEVNLVNSLWADPELSVDAEFLRRCVDLYAAQVFQQDLQAPETVQAVNAWVKEATQDLISSVVDRFDDQAVLALVNAVYLKNQFARPFVTPTSNWTMDFTASDGTVFHPNGMSNGTRTEQYIAAQDAQGVLLPYDDQRLGLLLMRPEDGASLTDYLSGWDGGTIPALLDSRVETEVSLTVPKFKADWSDELDDALASMGLTDAFDVGKADFTAMGSSPNGPLFIGQVIHKTAFELNEKGTEAAAVTAVIVDSGCALPLTERIELRFDRPFVYAIVDLETGFPLFLGTLEKP